MCAEHGVLEELCPKCHPELVAVFQAKGDWCPEHGFPESICPICHPERGGRPAADGASAQLEADLAKGPPDGIRVTLASPEAATVAGIRTAPVEAAPRERELGAIATIRYDATRVARLNPRAPGVVQTLAVDVGDKVATGQPLATIQSASVGESDARVAAAKARLALAKRQSARLAALAPDGATSTREVEQARGAVRDAEGEIAALLAGQALLGKTDGDAYRVESPIDGVVVSRTASIGAFVDHDDALFEVVDTRAMWAAIEVPEGDIGAVHEGALVTLTLDAVAERTFAGRVTYIAPEVDATSRTVLVRAALDNADGVLRANMFAHARLSAAPEPTPAPRFLVPRDAIQPVRDVQLVFVQVAEDVFEGRRVQVGKARPDGRVEVRGRLALGDRVVQAGAFALKTETLKDSIGAGCCADDGK